MVVRESAVLAAPSEEVAQRLVLQVCIAAALVVYVLIHLFALPWSRAAAAVIRGEEGAPARRARGWKIFMSATLTTVFVTVAGALVGWSWLLV